MECCNAIAFTSLSFDHAVASNAACSKCAMILLAQTWGWKYYACMKKQKQKGHIEVQKQTWSTGTHVHVKLNGTKGYATWFQPFGRRSGKIPYASFHRWWHSILLLQHCHNFKTCLPNSWDQLDHFNNSNGSFCSHDMPNWAGNRMPATTQSCSGQTNTYLTLMN